MNRQYIGLQVFIELGRAQIKCSLQIQPRLSISPEKAAKAQRSVGGNAAALQHDVVDS